MDGPTDTARCSCVSATKKIGEILVPVMAAVAVRKRIISIGHFSVSFCLQLLQFFVVCYATLHSALSVCPSVGPLAGCPCPAIRDDNVTPRYLFQFAK